MCFTSKCLHHEANPGNVCGVFSWRKFFVSFRNENEEQLEYQFLLGVTAYNEIENRTL